MSEKYAKIRAGVFGALYLIPAVFIISCHNPNKGTGNKPIATLQEYRELRQEKLNKQRPLVWDSDGCDALREEFPIDTLYGMYPRDKPFSIAGFLDIRTTPLIGTDVSTISLSTLGSGFGQFTHRTKAGTFFQADPEHPFPDSPTSFRIISLIPDFIKLGTDPLEVVTQFAHENKFEMFWSNRMNDTHDKMWDSLGRPSPLWTKFKADHPEYLFGKRTLWNDEKQTVIGDKLPHGAWSAVNFELPEIRNMVVQFFTEVCENYDVDGVVMDFFRHLHLFKNVANGDIASAEQIAMITDMVKQIREMTEKVGMKKGKPILLGVRIPDSYQYCRGIGIDLEGWMKDGLVDMVVGGSYFRLNPLKYLIDEGRKYNVKVYADLSETRVQNEHPLMFRKQNAVYYRSRAAAAWEAGVDGIYSFDEYTPKPARARYLWEIGNAEKLKNKNELYFVTDLAPVHGIWNSPSGYLKDGEQYYNRPVLIPDLRVPLNSKPIDLPIEIGNESAPAKSALVLYTRGTDPKLLHVSLNGYSLKYMKSDSQGLCSFDVSSGAVVRGTNNIKISYNQQSIGASKGAELLDAAMLFVRNDEDGEIKPLAAFCFGE
ncbi:MAG: hypothetical protein JNK79_17210 [Chitinophagaceae bacterium]|nr:hypothetical protein [Chitinophagaceae bacterium]